MNINTFNDGNFRALLRFRVDSGDTILEEHLKNGPKNSLYTSPGIQNEIISICGDIVKSKIIQRVNAAECFSVLADETTDIGRIEQMSVCLRYFDQGEKKICEDFLEFTPAVDLTGKGLATLIMSSLQNNGINCQFLVGQGYDGASAMSGYLHGAHIPLVVQLEFKKKSEVSDILDSSKDQMKNYLQGALINLQKQAQKVMKYSNNNFTELQLGTTARVPNLTWIKYGVWYAMVH
ncbi:uncharacterized protein LOC111028090 [Myzus persicae]|uniref:uncharacterized protein LOC111028090 n=1 Tax=Myzus persicae TaxID=13164 RepID=UPI000B939359|nr:uncharacterized protein LOC111028090 [Myzus persicae]